MSAMRRLRRQVHGLKPWPAPRKRSWNLRFVDKAAQEAWRAWHDTQEQRLRLWNRRHHFGGQGRSRGGT